MAEPRTFEKRTIENTLRYHTPRPNWEFDQSWDWPYEKFGYPNADVLFTHLHVKYNSIRCAIQDPQAWHLDVCEIAHHADTKKEFLEKLAKRQQERYEELEEAWETTCALLVGEPDRMENREVPDYYDMWERMVSVARNFAFDTFVDFFGLWVHDIRRSDETRPEFGATRPAAQTRAENEKQNFPGVERALERALEPEVQHEVPHEVRPNSPPPNEPPITITPQPTQSKNKPRATGSGCTRSKTPDSREPAQSRSRLTGRTTTKPNGIRKQPPRRKTEATSPTGLRRSARLKQRAARGKK